MSLKNDGYLILKNVFSEEEIQPIKEYVSLLESNAKKDNYNPLNEHYLPNRYDNGVLYDAYQKYPIFQPLAHNKKIIAAVKTALGEDFYLYVNSVLYKPADQTNNVPWHQDFLSRPNESEKIIAWMALDNATKENGCLKIIPNSHKNGFRKWYRVKNSAHHDRITLNANEEDDAIYVELNQGDVLLFVNYLIHSSDQNSSNLPRRAYRVVYKRLDDSKIPRGAPIMISGGDPENLSNHRPPKNNAVKKFINRVGNYLAKI